MASIELLTVTTMTESFILFDNEYYKQHWSTNGFPTRTNFANIFLCVHKILWLEKCLPEFRPVIYSKHVDNTFLLFQNINQIEDSDVTLTSNVLILNLPLEFR